MDVSDFIITKFTENTSYNTSSITILLLYDNTMQPICMKICLGKLLNEKHFANFWLDKKTTSVSSIFVLPLKVMLLVLIMTQPQINTPQLYPMDVIDFIITKFT